MNTARSSTGSRSVASDLVFSVLALLLALRSPIGATTADDICAPETDPCTVTTQVAVTDGSVLAFGARQLIIAAGGDLNVGSGMMTITAAEVRIEANGELQALGRNEPGGQINVTAGMLAISGKISADGNNGGMITISAMQMVNGGTISADGGHGGVVSVAVTGELVNAGRVSADGSGAEGIGGSVDVMAGFATIAGSVTARAAGDNLGGCITASTEGDLTFVGTMRVDGGDGGDIVVMAGTNAGNLVIDASALIAANGSGSNGGSGGGIEMSARGDGIASGFVSLNGRLQSRAGTLQGGDGGCITITAAGDIIGQDPGGELNVNSGSPDGFAGEINLVAAGSVQLRTELSAQGSGSEGAGGDIELQAGGDILIDTQARISAAGPGDGGFIDLNAVEGELTIRSRFVDASGTTLGGGDGGEIRLRASGAQGRVTVVGMVSANGSTLASAPGRGGAIDISAGNSISLAGPAAPSGGRVLAQGGTGGTITMRAARGTLQIDGEVSAPGTELTGGAVTAVAGGALAIRGEVEVNGNVRGGRIAAEAMGPVTLDGSIEAAGLSAGDGDGGVIDVIGAGPIVVTGQLNADGAPSGGTVTLTACDVALIEGSVLSAHGADGVNRISGRRLLVVGGTLSADVATGQNALVYRDATNPPLIFASAMVEPAATLVQDPTLDLCAVCGDRTVEPPETCDDGNRTDGDGCSATCQVEAIRCDVDGDGEVDLADLIGLEQELFDGDGDRALNVGGGGFPGTIGADANDDGRVTSADLTSCIEVLGTE